MKDSCDFFFENLSQVMFSLYEHYIKQTQVYCNFLCSCVVVLDSWIVCIPMPSILHYRKIAVRNLRIYMQY